MSEVITNQNDELTNLSEESGSVINTKTSLDGIVGMINSIDEMGKSIEMQRQLVDAKGRLRDLCFELGIKEDDQEFIHKKFMDNEYTDDTIKLYTKDLDTINLNFFTRDDGTVIKVKSGSGETEQYNVKKDFIVYLNGFYDMEKTIVADIDAINKDIADFKNEEVSSMAATIANGIKSGIEARKKESLQMDDEFEKSNRLKLLDRMESGYTFQAMIDVLERYPKVARSTIDDMKNAEKVKEVGKRYVTKLHQRNVVSTLYGTIFDDISKSIETQFLCKEDYVEGYENLFAFYLIRFFSKEDWSPKSYTKEMHNACSIILNNLLSGNLDKELRDEVVANITKIWRKFKEVLSN